MKRFFQVLAMLCAMVLVFCAMAEESATIQDVTDGDVLYQVALLQSLAQGYFDGIVTVGELKRHGDTGIGTFEGVNGEMIVLDGTVYQAVADGSIAIPSDEETVPFSNVTYFDVDETLALSGIAELAAQIEALRRVQPSVRIGGALVTMWHNADVVAQGEELLRRSGYAELYPHNRRDAILIYGLIHEMNFFEINDQLFEKGEETLC